MSLWRKLFGGVPTDGGLADDAPLRYPAVPAYHEVVFEELAVRVFCHEVFQGAASIPCWSYVTDGMRRHGQKEFIFTLKRRPEESPEEYPREVLKVFALIHSQATQGKLVDVHEFTQFRLPEGFLGQVGVVALAYAPWQKLPGVNVPEVPLMAVLMLGDEVAFLESLRAYRVLTRLGEAGDCFPTPPWCDRDREPLLSRAEVQRGIFGRIPGVYFPAARVRLHLNDTLPPPTGDRLVLRVQATATHQIRELFQKIEAAMPFLWVMPPAEDAESLLVHQPGSTRSEAIGAPGGCQSGGFIAFVPSDEMPQGGQIFEDGFLVTLKRASMAKFREALLRGERLDVDAGPDRVRFSLHWDYPERNGTAVEFENGLLYQPEALLQERLPDRNAFMQYVTQLRFSLQRFLDLLPSARGQNLLFVAALRPGGKVRFWLDVTPDGFPPEWKQELEERLRILPVPPVVGGVVAYALVGKLWGGTGTPLTPTQRLPEEWRRAAVQLGSQGPIDTDQVVRAIWPDPPAGGSP